MADEEVSSDGKVARAEEMTRRLSARASGANGAAMTEDEMEAAEREAEEWARRVNCC